MKGYLHYNIWNKESHVEWILRSINYFIPKDTIIDFSFESCTDSSISIFNQYKDIYLKQYHVIYTETDIKYRMKNFNEAIKRFLNTDCDFIVSPQDDQFIQDANIMENLINIFKSNNNVGLIGMRDGFTFNYENYYSSHFSFKTDFFKKWLKSGEYINVKNLNDGPLALSRETIEKVGLFDDDMNVFYIENDYCARCLKAGLSNYVMGVELLHIKLWLEIKEKVYGVIASEVYDKNFGEIDLNIFNRKHPDINKL